LQEKARKKLTEVARYCQKLPEVDTVLFLSAYFRHFVILRSAQTLQAVAFFGIRSFFEGFSEGLEKEARFET